MHGGARQSAELDEAPVMGRDVSRLPRVSGPARTHPRAVQSRAEAAQSMGTMGNGTVDGDHPPARTNGSQRYRPVAKRPMSAPAQRDSVPGVRPRQRPSSARPMGRPSAEGANAQENWHAKPDATISAGDWAAPSVLDRRHFAVEPHFTDLQSLASAPKYGAPSLKSRRSPAGVAAHPHFIGVGGGKAPVAVVEIPTAWGNGDGTTSEGPDASPPAAPPTSPGLEAPQVVIRPTDHETSRRNSRSPLVTSSLSSIGLAGGEDWMSSSIDLNGPPAVRPSSTRSSGEALAARRLQLEDKPWRQRGRRRRQQEDSRPEPSGVGKAWSPAGAQKSPQRKRVSMAVPRKIRPLEVDASIAAQAGPSSPLRAMRAKQEEREAGGSDKSQAEESTEAPADETPAAELSLNELSLEDAVRVTTQGALAIAEVLRKSGRRDSTPQQLDANTDLDAEDRGRRRQTVSAEEVKSLEVGAQRMSAAAYIIEKLVRTLNGEAQVNAEALKEHAKRAPRVGPRQRHTEMVSPVAPLPFLLLPVPTFRLLDSLRECAEGRTAEPPAFSSEKTRPLRGTGRSAQLLSCCLFVCRR